MIVVRSGVAVRIAQHWIARIDIQRVDCVAISEGAYEFGHGGVICEREVHVAYAAHLPFQEYRRFVGLACAHGCGVELSVAIVALLAIDVPAELWHNHKRLHGSDGRLQRQLVGPCMHEGAHGVVRVERCRRAVHDVLLVVVGEEVACGVSAGVFHVVCDVDIHLLAEPMLKRGAELGGQLFVVA